MDIRAYMAQVPETARFLTVDELHADLARLAAAHPDLARLRRVGTSRLGEPLHLLSLGHGRRSALVFGCPHPNEPIGAMMLHHLTHRLCEDAALREALDYTWHVIPCVDPDGTRLNEGWFAGPFTPTHYARHFYRPASDQQVEWTFPVSYQRLYFDRVLPETQMLMRVIDEARPEFMFSLHNAGFGGVYYYISRPAAPLYETFHRLPDWEGLPLNLGEPETPFMQELAPAVFRMPTSRESYDYLEAHGGDPTKRVSGTSSHDYASKYGTFTLVVEMPYFDDQRVNDLTATDTLRRDAILRGLDLREELATALRPHYDAVAADLRGQSPFQQAVAAMLETSGNMLAAERNWAREAPETARPATVAEVFSSDQHTQFYRLLTVGMAVRLLEGEVGIGNG
ncbi:MAG TPA: M14 family zinc carboxypeptidase, partial [Thermomicrobiales bacterium]|nr:M14 family zinc carboxypeptidase [Thermomicrobiales bacterium]